MEFSWRDCSLHNRLSPRFRTPRSKRSQRAVICVTQSKITWSVRTCGPRSFDQKTRAAKSADRARAKNTPQGRAAPNPLREKSRQSFCYLFRRKPENRSLALNYWHWVTWCLQLIVTCIYKRLAFQRVWKRVFKATVRRQEVKLANLSLIGF